MFTSSVHLNVNHIQPLKTSWYLPPAIEFDNYTFSRTVCVFFMMITTNNDYFAAKYRKVNNLLETGRLYCAVDIKFLHGWILYDIVRLLKGTVYMACRKKLQGCCPNYMNMEFYFKIPLENWTFKIKNII